MTAVMEPFSALGQAQVEAALRFATIAAEGAERLVELQVKTAKSAFNDGLKNAKGLAEVKDLAELPTWTGTNFQPGIEKTTAYARSLYEVAAGTQSEFGSLLEEQLVKFNENLVVALDTALKSAPAGSETAVSAVKSVIGVANSVFESIAKATKQLAAMTEANLASAAAATPAGGTTRKKAA